MTNGMIWQLNNVMNTFVMSLNLQSTYRFISGIVQKYNIL